MTTVIPFPGTVTALGFRFAAEAIRDGTARAERAGIGRGRIAALMHRDQPFATYFLAHLGSADAWDRRVGEFGLRRLLSSMEASVR